MAIDLRTKFEKLVAKAKCADPSKDWEATPREVWKQCDRCLKWRRVEVVGKQQPWQLPQLRLHGFHRQ